MATPKKTYLEFAANDWEVADASAIQALGAGTADAEQQRRALKWIIEKGAATYDISFQPGGPDGARLTEFAEGRRFVGTQIVKLLKVSLAAMARRKTGVESEQG